MTTTLDIKLTERQLRNRDERFQRKKIEASLQKNVSSIIILVEWKKSRTWGRNPHATANIEYKDGTYAEGHATASGCGYCKESSVLAEIFNTYLRYKLFQPFSVPLSSLPYGIRLPKEGDKFLPYYEGGIGVNCYSSITEAIGGEWENLAHNKTISSYRAKFSRRQVS